MHEYLEVIYDFAGSICDFQQQADKLLSNNQWGVNKIPSCIVCVTLLYHAIPYHIISFHSIGESAESCRSDGRSNGRIVRHFWFDDGKCDTLLFDCDFMALSSAIDFHSNSLLSWVATLALVNRNLHHATQSVRKVKAHRTTMHLLYANGGAMN